MKKLVVNIKAPKDNTLDKVRVYVGPSSTSASLFVAGNLVYEGAIQASVKTDKYTNKAKNYIGIEYFNDAGKVFRSTRPKPRFMIDDMGPWDYAANKFLQGDEELGLLDNSTTALPAPFVVYQKAMNDAFAKVAEKHGSGGILVFPVYPTSAELNVFTVNGEIIALVNNSSYYSATLARTQVSFAALEAMTEAERTLVINGFKWRIEPIYQEDIRWLQDQLVHTYSFLSGSSAPYTKKFAVLTDLPAALVGAYAAATSNGFATPFKSGTLAGQWARWTGAAMTTDQSDIDFTYSFGNTTTNCQFQLRYVGRE